MNQDVLANWNGVEMPLHNVKVSVLDRGFMFGDAVYETVRIYAGQLFHVRDHLDRLANSLASMKIAGVDMSVVHDRLLQTLEHSTVSEGVAYLQITRGEAPRTHIYPRDVQPNILIYVDHFEDPYKPARDQGVSVITHPDIRWGRNDIKATSLAANCLAAQYAYEHGCTEVLFINAQGFVTEGSHTSVFGVKDGELIVAPASANVLPGITKKLVLGLATAGNIPLSETRIKQEDIFLLDEMFLAGTSKEIIPIIRVDDRLLGNGLPGPVVKRLQKEYGELVRRTIKQPVEK